MFGNLGRTAGDSPQARALSERTMGAWTRFAATGAPGLAWPRVTSAGDAYLDIGGTTRANTGFRADRCDELDRW